MEHKVLEHQWGAYEFIRCSCGWAAGTNNTLAGNLVDRFGEHIALAFSGEIETLKREAVDYRDVVRHAQTILQSIYPNKVRQEQTVLDWMVKCKAVLDYEPKGEANPAALVSLTWSDVFDADREHFIVIDYGRARALSDGFRYMCWNDRVYAVSDKGWRDVGMLRKDVAPKVEPVKTPGQIRFESQIKGLKWEDTPSSHAAWEEDAARATVRAPRVGDVVLYHVPFCTTASHPAPAFVLYVENDLKRSISLEYFGHAGRVAREVYPGTGPGQWSFREDA